MATQPGEGLDPVFGPSKGDHGPHPPAYPPLTLGPYFVEREVGRGTGSVVYRAIDPKDHSVVALKVLYAGSEGRSAEQWAKAVAREAAVLKPLSHPHIVGLKAHGQIDGLAYLAYPFVRGLPLDKALASGMLDSAAALHHLVKVARAVDYAHGRGLIHRDLKPGNILAGLDGEPYVLDFGLSWRKGEKSETGIQSIVGTPSYMSPEQARGEEEHLTPATDVYSLGAILYEVLAGRPPFAGATAWKTRQLVMAAPPSPLKPLVTGLDPNLEKLIFTCLEKAPEKRYDSAARLADDLERVLAGQAPKGPSGKTFLGRLFR